MDYESRQQYVVPIVVEAMGHVVTGHVTVNVLDMNEAHVITNLPATRRLSALGSPKDMEVRIPFT